MTATYTCACPDRAPRPLAEFRFLWIGGGCYTCTDCREAAVEVQQPIGFTVPGTLETPPMRLEGPVVERLPETTHEGQLATYRGELYMFMHGKWIADSLTGAIAQGGQARGTPADSRCGARVNDDPDCWHCEGTGESWDYCLEIHDNAMIQCPSCGGSGKHADVLRRVREAGESAMANAEPVNGDGATCGGV